MKTLYLLLLLILGQQLYAQTTFSCFGKIGGSHLILSTEEDYNSNLAVLYGGGILLDMASERTLSTEIGFGVEHKKGLITAFNLPIFDVFDEFTGVLINDEIELSMTYLTVPIGLNYKLKDWTINGGFRAAALIGRSGKRVREVSERLFVTFPPIFFGGDNRLFRPSIKSFDLGFQFGARYPLVPRFLLSFNYYRSLIKEVGEDTGFIPTFSQQQLSFGVIFKT